ncbi:MAG: penicillin-binding protein 1A [Pseudomonadota bacterium]
MNRKTLLRVGLVCGALGISAAVAATGAVLAAYHYAKPGLPDAATVKDIPLQVPLRVYTRDGRLIQEIGEQRRVLVAYDDIPLFVVQAFLAAEDDRFFEHPGIDYQGVLRAVIKNVLAGRRGQGASTLTQQLARDYFLSRERSYVRKLKEAFLSYKIEQEFTKEEIMEMFLNKMFFGQRAYGVAAAAQVYFGKELANLEVAEAATLAGVLQRPSYYNPVSGPESAKRRRAYVLRRMHELDFIDDATYERSMAYPMQSYLHGPDIELEAPYLAEMVRREVTNRFGKEVTTRGYRVITTIDSRLQAAANHAVRDGLMEYDRRHGFRGPLTTLDLESVDDATIEQTLEDYRSPGKLRTGLVVNIDVELNQASVRLAAGELVTLPWSGAAWAAPFIERSRVGNAPESMAEVLKPGDVVRLYLTLSGTFALGQIPEAQAALVALDPTDGAIAALTGGFDYSSSKFNRAVQIKRQPGSSFKPFIYSAALANGFTPASVINDNPVTISSSELEEVWKPKNSTGRFYGETRLRDALVRSLNLVSVRMMMKMGVSAARRHLRQFGFADEALPANLSLALGSGAASPLTMADAYATLANGGYDIQPYFIDRIELADGTLIEFADPRRVCHECELEPEPDTQMPEEPERVEALVDPNQKHDAPVGEALIEFLDPETVAQRTIPASNIWLIQDMMRDVIRRGTGRRARALGRNDLAGKTGTSNDQRDAWFGGFNPDLVAVTWVGFDTDEPLGRGEEGGRTALPIWVHFMRDALLGVPEGRYPQPDGLVTVRIDPKTGTLAGASASNFLFETFEDGTQPQTVTESSPFDPYQESQPEVDEDDVF